MKKGVKITLIILFVIIILSSAGFFYIFTQGFAWFGSQGRYDSSVLNDMGVIYESQSDINGWAEGFSNTDNCPWGFVHEGLDYFYNNNSAVLAAAPGKIIDIQYRDNGDYVENRYWVRIDTLFNRTVEVSYNFESWTNKTADWENQQRMISVQKGDWVEKGQEIGRFLKIGDGAHIHFGVKERKNTYCPQKYLSTTAYNELLSLVHFYHPIWDLCYVE